MGKEEARQKWDRVLIDFNSVAKTEIKVMAYMKCNAINGEICNLSNKR